MPLADGGYCRWCVVVDDSVSGKETWRAGHYMRLQAAIYHIGRTIEGQKEKDRPNQGGREDVDLSSRQCAFEVGVSERRRHSD